MDSIDHSMTMKIEAGVRLEKLRLVLKIRDVMCESLVEVVGVRG